MSEDLKIYIVAAFGVMTIIQVMIVGLITGLQRYIGTRFDELE